MRTHGKRLGRLQTAIDASPVQRHLLREAYEWFTSFGELPDDDHLAYEVVQQALRGGKEAPLDYVAVVCKSTDRARLAYHQKTRPGAAWPPTVRALLFDEALFEPPALRRLARAVIALEVARGGDVENPAFGASHGIPSYGSVAMHVFGWPARLAVPPYEDQAKRLFVRLDRLRGTIDRDNPDWFAALGKAYCAFLEAGDLPSDDLILEGVLINVELDLLQAHGRGGDVGEAMHLLDRLARGPSEDADEALAQLAAMAKNKRLWAVSSDAGRRSRPRRPTPPAP